jgi:histidinol phosphatase-like enzyme (inositol monophosphatase family)
MVDPAPLETFALRLSAVAAEAILPLYRADHGLADKGAKTGKAFDPVTEADRGAEAAIRKAIAAAYPDHGVIGEEYGEDRPDAEFVWVLDPIDGTRAFISGLPLWTTLIALRHKGEPVIGVIAQPFLNEVFVGGPSGARLLALGEESGGRPLQTRPCASLEAALGATTDPYLFKGDETAAFARLRAATRLVRYGADAYAYAMTALGTLDFVVETGLKAWDIEAAVPLIRAAGGYIGDWSGGAAGGEKGRLLILGDPARLDEASAVLEGRP